MSAKKKSHGVLFTPYLQKDENLLWVGIPVKNEYLSFRFDKAARDSFGFALIVAVAMIYLAFGIYIGWEHREYVFMEETNRYINTVASLITSFLLVCALLIFTRIGKVYYAITTKRLFVLRRPLWKSLDAASLMLLPEFNLEQHGNEAASIHFAALRIEEIHNQGRVSYVEIHRAHLEKMSKEDAELAYDLLEAARNDVLDKRACELGLMQ